MDGSSRRSGVLVLPPVGYPYWTSHRTLRVVAERLASQGHMVLRVDYDGTGDSAGDQWDTGRLDAWQQTVAHAAAHLRSLGASQLTVLGARVGASLALALGQSLDADRVVAWAPVARGRRYAKEITLLSVAVPPESDPFDGTRALTGTVFSAETIQALAAIDLTTLGARPAQRILLLDTTPDGGRLADSLSELGAEVTHDQTPGAETAFDTPTEFATVPDALVEKIAAWVGGGDGGDAGDEIEIEPSTTMAWRRGEVRETVIELEPEGHVAVVTEPGQHADPAGTLVFLNPGSETHVGPGRAWVEFARDLALRGHRAVRVDFLDWGESPDAGSAPGRPYDPAGVADTNTIAAAVRARYGRPVVVLGLCAAAWIALKAVLEGTVDGVIALNAQTYWRQGDPVNIGFERTRIERAVEIEEIARGAQDGTWDAQDAAGDRPPVARWLEAIAATGIPTELLFAEGDDGLTYLNQRFSRRLQDLQSNGALPTTELIGVDHPLHRTWARSLAFDAIAASFERMISQTAQLTGVS